MGYAEENHAEGDAEEEHGWDEGVYDEEGDVEEECLEEAVEEAAAVEEAIGTDEKSKQAATTLLSRVTRRIQKPHEWPKVWHDVVGYRMLTSEE